MRIALIGQGGVGKSLLAYKFSRYLQQHNLSCEIVNLDPGCKHVKYEAAFDLRKKYSLEKVMASARLGPGGALKKIYSDLAEDRKALREINAAKADFVLVDTAGSIELFLFEDTAALLKRVADLVLFVVDNEAMEKETDLTVLKAVNAIQSMKYGLPTLTVVNKRDLLKRRRKQTKLAFEHAVDAHLTRLLDEIGRSERVILVSALEKQGFRELLDTINESKCSCGDLS